MNSLREWLIKNDWYIVDCDPSPDVWQISALSPDGRLMWFSGTEARVERAEAR